MTGAGKFVLVGLALGLALVALGLALLAAPHGLPLRGEAVPACSSCDARHQNIARIRADLSQETLP